MRSRHYEVLRHARKRRNNLNNHDGSLNEGFFKSVTSAEKCNPSFSLSLSLSLNFRLSLTYVQALLRLHGLHFFVRLARSIQFTFFLFFTRRGGIRTEQRKETYVLFRRKELQPLEGQEERRRKRDKKGWRIPLSKAQENLAGCLKLRGCFETSQFHSSRPGPVPEDSARFRPLSLLSLDNPGFLSRGSLSTRELVVTFACRRESEHSHELFHSCFTFPTFIKGLALIHSHLRASGEVERCFNCT